MPRLTKPVGKSAATKAAKAIKPKPMTLAQVAIAALEDMKAVDIKVIDVMKLTTITDTMIVCTGTSNRHVKSLADNVIQTAKDFGNRPIGIEGIEQGEWVLVDLGGVVVHVMQVQARAFYQLERLWDVAPPEPQETPKPVRDKGPQRARAGNAAKKMGKQASKGSVGKAGLKAAKRVKTKSEDKPVSRAAARAADKPKKGLAAGRKFVSKTTSSASKKPVAKAAAKKPASKAGFKAGAKPVAKKPATKKPVRKK